MLRAPSPRTKGYSTLCLVASEMPGPSSSISALLIDYQS
jgi:hypothetical protein